ncbi:MAG TPA: hypothetical protein VGH49_04705 [Xanthobacteraceae bacterium]
MAVRYLHTQPGTFMLVGLLAGAVVFASVGYLKAQPGARWPAWTVAIVMAILAWLFSSLTVEVNDREVRWHFGPGLWQHHIALSDIEDVRIVRNKWWNGFGIRMRPGFRLYNVSGFDAVELRLKTGDIRRIGTDDPQGLSAALKSSIAAPAGTAFKSAASSRTS